MTDEIKERIKQVEKGNVPEGYVPTLLGVRPSDWKLKKIGAAIKNTPRPIKMNDSENYQLITVRRAYGGIVSRGIYKGKEILVKAQYRIAPGDFIISKRQIVHGACGVARQESNNAIVSNEYNVFTMNTGYNLEYFNFSMQLPKAKHLFYLMSIGVHIEKMLFGTAEWLRQKIAFPTYTEQEKIAVILTHCDKVIELKKQLILEERERKKWLIQNLLDPNSGVRLDGFNDEWTEKAINEIAFVISGGTPDTNKSDYWNGSILWCTPTDITSSRKYISETQQRITSQGLKASSATLLPVGSILMCSRATIGSKAIAGQPITTNQGFKSFVCKESLNNEFFYYYLEIVLKDFLRLASGNTFKELSKASVDNFIVKIPTLDEQIAIANILSIADRKIELLDQELEQWQQKKKSLMQLLLTGIVRVKL